VDGGAAEVPGLRLRLERAGVTSDGVVTLLAMPAGRRHGLKTRGAGIPARLSRHSNGPVGAGPLLKPTTRFKAASWFRD
jgi:hypothetical protein